MSATRDEIGRVLCCHGRPIACNECGEDYASELDGPAGGACGDASFSSPRSTGTPFIDCPLCGVRVEQVASATLSLTGKIITMRFSGESMAEVALEHCRHGGDACFVNKGDVRQVADR